MSDPFIGERSAAKLAYGETGNTLFETANELKTEIDWSQFNVQPLGQLLWRCSP